MSRNSASFCALSTQAAAGVAGVRVAGGKSCKRVACMAAGLLMVKKSKKRNPI